MKIYVVNSFTKGAEGGNAAGVVVCSSFPPEHIMQEAARRAGFSETVFICPDREGFKTRFFTPSSEVELCGHATIAAFYLLGRMDLIDKKEGEAIVKQITKAGELKVYIYFDGGMPVKVMMEQAPPEVLGTIEGEALKRLCSLLRIEKNQVGLREGLVCMPEIVSTGLPDIMFPVVSRDALLSINPDYDGLAHFSKELGVVSVHAFTLETVLPSSTVHCRNFGPAVGIQEESATGTSNGTLGYYLFSKGLLEGHKMISEQGYCMGKPSLIYVNVCGDIVKVGGSAVYTGAVDIDV